MQTQNVRKSSAARASPQTSVYSTSVGSLERSPDPLAGVRGGLLGMGEGKGKRTKGK